MSLHLNKIVYINVGGEGLSNNGTLGTVEGGYNGGGNAAEGLSNNYVASGGGATSLANSSGLLYSFYSEFVDLRNDIFIVSGGGGGAIHNISYPSFANGGHAGGFKGSICETQTDRTKIKKPSGGTQENGGEYGLAYSSGYIGIDKTNGDGAFGKGGSPSATSGDVHVSGGGAGYYGGGAGYLMSTGGGSSYIGNSSLTDKAMYCYDCEESLDTTNPNIFTVSTTGTSTYKDTTNCPNGYSESPVSKCAKKGNGYARITLVSKN